MLTGRWSSPVTLSIELSSLSRGVGSPLEKSALVRSGREELAPLLRESWCGTGKGGASGYLPRDWSWLEVEGGKKKV